jgi:hypothetical protein
MGTFAEIAIIDYCLSLVDQVPFAANKRKFAVSVFRLFATNSSCRFLLVHFSVCGIPETHGDMET